MSCEASRKNCCSDMPVVDQVPKRFHGLVHVEAENQIGHGVESVGVQAGGIWHRPRTRGIATASVSDVIFSRTSRKTRLDGSLTQSSTSDKPQTNS